MSSEGDFIDPEAGLDAQYEEERDELKKRLDNARTWGERRSIRRQLRRLRLRYYGVRDQVAHW